ncbi:MAG TPA: hypothetical protein VK009_30135 [Chloroflexota bacterium]|nr:hypothetical protein [Chloroflexota bacterium]
MAAERRLPPVSQLCITSMVLVVIGGIYLAAYLPGAPSLVLPTILAILAAVVMAANVAALSRVKVFAWPVFFKVIRWALLAYVITSGMIELVFVLDGTPAGVLGLLTAMLAIYAVDIPLLLAFTVARYQPA